jgi:glycosyltransferase involved in cell wall biosynthesis
MTQPSIAIVVPSFNQAQYLGETLQSLVDQHYPSLEVIVQEGGSTDRSLEIAQDFARRYPGIFRVYSEKDSGQADAINRGMARTSAEILGFLNSDDTLFPDTLASVARQIDPGRGRYVVMGRCLFTGVNSRYVGVEHPAEFVSHFEQLAIWKRGYNTIPQPSVFWHRSVWERCGPLDVNEHHALDYDLFCRFSRYYVFHRVDELWSTYRMHDESKSSKRTEAEVLALSIEVSRKHWGSWLHPLRWHCEASYRLYRLHLHERGRHHARRAEQALRDRRYAAAAGQALLTFAVSPGMALSRLAGAWLSPKRGRLFDLFLAPAPPAFTARYADGWLGPRFREPLEVPQSAQRLFLTLEYKPWTLRRRSMRVQLFVDAAPADGRTVREPGAFTLQADVTSRRGRPIDVQVHSSRYFVPNAIDRSDDHRQLSLRLQGIVFESAPPDSA